jgi:hypothetical protein
MNFHLALAPRFVLEGDRNPPHFAAAGVFDDVGAAHAAVAMTIVATAVLMVAAAATIPMVMMPIPFATAITLPASGGGPAHHHVDVRLSR